MKKLRIKNISRWIPVLFFGIAVTLFTNCENDVKFNDLVPDYTYSIMRSFEANGQKATIRSNQWSGEFNFACGS